MIKIGITGQAGFVGTHLFETLKLKNDVQTIPFEDSFWNSNETLDAFVSSCNVIVHLAAMNRHESMEVLYNTNVQLVNDLVGSLERCDSKARVLFSSSIQETRGNLYGDSKKEGRRLFNEWANRTEGSFGGLLIPNVFGPFGRPNYNSVVATFCHKMTHHETPTIIQDGELNLIYVGELVDEIYQLACAETVVDCKEIAATSTMKVSEILSFLEVCRAEYLEKGIIPSLISNVEVQLFNTFRCAMDIKGHYPVMLTKHTDPRGSFVETIRLGVGGQVSFSTTVPGITRGNHFHTRKIERFCVIKGKALIQLRRIGTDEVLDFYLDGENPSYVDMPIWYTHNIKNIGEEELYTMFWINEFYNENDPDTYFEEV
ncbi:NAD-dependent epimerase/dehydratase family protein [Halosquirtibacter xylanolyticus]|uniref:polysaccharide biosynthesis C-terminal domain-containing protein n=1 Tax=Halosquirtibacter xylanolyticus TaxID=3374599 RepID=UPI00374957AD|nr:NAD-dependent epimerase/dehydratase family protein [Prolixibacteraceae bacterium]